MKFSIIQLIWICLLGLTSQRVYISNSNEGVIPNDITNEFSDQINDNLLSRTLSEGRRDNQMAYKQAGLQLQNKSIDRNKMDSVGKKLLDKYNEAIKEIKEEKKSTSDIKQEKAQQDLKKNATGPQERRLYQTYAAPMMMAQPQIAYQQPQIAYQQPPITYQQPQMMQQQYVSQPRTMYNNTVPVNNQQVTNNVQTANPSAIQTLEVKADTPSATDQKLDDKKAVANTDTTKPLTVKTDTKKDAKRKLWRRRRRRRKRRRHHRGRHRGRHRHHRGRHGHRHRRRRMTPAQRYAKKIRSKRNMTLMNQSLKLKLQKAQISLQSRGKFDRLREKKLKGAAELWTRTFIYDAVLLTEKILYQKHRKSVKSKMAASAKGEAQETIDIAKFYNKYYGKSPDEYKAEDLQFHIFD